MNDALDVLIGGSIGIFLLVGLNLVYNKIKLGQWWV